MKKKYAILYTVLSLFLLVNCDDSKPNRPPSLEISANPVSGFTPLTVNFAAAATDPEGGSLTFEWNFGDGSTVSTEQNPTYTYTTIGKYTSTCKVTDSGSPPLSAVKSIEINVLRNSPQLYSISPTLKAQHLPEFTLTANGENFSQDSIIVFNGTAKETSYISPTLLTCQIESLNMPESQDSSAESYVDIPVFIRNPDPNGGDSNVINFKVHQNHIFGDPVLVASALDAYPAIAVGNEGQVNIVCFKGGLYYSSSDDGGISWNGKVIHSCNTPSIGDFADIKATDDGIFIVSSGGSGFHELLFVKSEDGGITWSEGREIPGRSVTERAQVPSIMISTKGGAIHVAWFCKAVDMFPFGIHYNYSTDKGEYWREGYIIFSYSDTLKEIIKPSLALSSGGSVHMVAKKDSSKINYSLEWFLPKTIPVVTSNLLGSLMLRIDKNDNFNLLWIGSVAGGSDIFFMFSSDQAQTWSYPNNITKNPRSYGDPAVAIDTMSNINVVFSADEENGNSYIYFMRSIDGGNTWSVPVKLSEISGVAGRHSIAIDKFGNVNIVWRASKGDKEVYFTRNIQ